ncbi:MAG: Alanine racemase [Chthoniobacteraceae bacterium]|nr:Alanine racemase [Chthoniobacteraceae bacterium]
MSERLTAAYRCWAEIDFPALQRNLAAVRTCIGEGTAIMAVVKANAYGHGMAEVVRALSDRVEMFGVANLSEARALYAAAGGSASRIYILGPALPGERPEIVKHGFVPAVSSAEEAAAYSALAMAEIERQNPAARFSIHLTIDTGMGRIGVWQDEAVAAARDILKLPGVKIAGFASHLPVSDEDDAFTHAELARFRALVIELRALGLESAIAHIENSAGIIGFSSQAGDLVRAGLMLYGSSPRPDFQSKLTPVLTWKSRVTLVRDVPAGRGISYGRTFITPKPMRIATLGVGYADGYPRHLSGKNAEVLIRGSRCAVLGRVTMDQILVDVSAWPDVAPGEEVVLLGQQGRQEILAAELAEKAGTIPWEIFTGIGTRVVRIPARCQTLP